MKGEKLMKKIWPQIKWLFNYMASISMYAIIVLLIMIGAILLAYFVDVQKRAKTGVWKPPLYGAYVIVSNSMEPIIKVKDAIIIKRVDIDEIEVGDVVTYKALDPAYYGILITHRVVDIKTENGETIYITKGDHNPTIDRTPVAASQIHGKVIMRVPKIGYIQYFLATAYGWIIAIVIPCVGVISYDIYKLIKTIKSEMRNNKRKNRVINNEG